MNVLIFAPDVEIDGAGGGPTHLRELASELSELEHEVSVISRGRSTSHAISHYQLPNFGSGIFGLLMTALSAALLCLVATVKENIDVVYSRHTYSIFSLLCAKIMSREHIVEVNGNMTLELNSEDEKLLSYYGRLTEWSYQYSSEIVAVSEDVKKEIVSKGVPPANVHIVQNGVNLETFSPRPTAECRDKLGLNQSHFYIVFVGNLHSWQGIDYLIEALQIADLQTEVRLLVVGDGPKRSELEELADELEVREKVTFTGRVPYNEVSTYICASDLGFLYRPPGLAWSPLKLYEYLACKTPVLASDVGEFGFIPKKEFGTLVPPQSEQDLADTLEDLAESGGHDEFNIDDARTYVHKNHSWTQTAEKVSDICRSMI